jgi:hypothetical protein
MFDRCTRGHAIFMYSKALPAGVLVAGPAAAAAEVSASSSHHCTIKRDINRN